MNRRVASVWSAVLILLAVLLAVLGFYSRDPDSALHAAIVAHSYERPVTQWIAPSWGGQWGRNDLYREHPAGVFLLPSALARVGYPAEQAAFAVNAAFQILTLLALARFAAVLMPAVDARRLSWILLLLPIAFTYRLRANHEQAILLLTVVALDAAERARNDRRWSAVIAVAGMLAFMVKGVFALPLLATCGIWYLLRRPAAGRRLAAWGALLLASAATVLAAAAYEMVYRGVTGGDTFLGYYLRQQLGLAAESTGNVAIAKVTNLAWYGSRLLWFSAPWSLVLIAQAGAVWRRDSRQVVWPLIAAALVWPLMFSLSDRHADRYIFPAYYLLGAAGVVVAFDRWPSLRRATATVERLFPFEQVALWSLLTLLTLLAWFVNLPRVQL